MKIFKFGGASVNNVDRIRQLADILRLYPDDKKMVVISAMGKTTNALEKVVKAFFDGRKEEALQLFEHIKKQHLNTAKYLLVTSANATDARLLDFFTEVEWALHDKPVKDFDYYYDQIVCVGELFSSTIISAYLNEQGINNIWTDVRDIFRTDDHFRNAGIDREQTEKNIRDKVVPFFDEYDIVVTQGFIGATDENESTTLGREGSDYSAAVFGNLLGAEDVTIWKDVAGIMNADPKIFPAAVVMPELSYDELIEMAYYGAQVIHPKTIKPLENKNIPLVVKCFIDPALPGTVIHHKTIKNLPPVFVIKQNQALLHLHSRDFSFIGEHAVSRLYHLLAQKNITPNLIQTDAVTLMVCIDDMEDEIGQLAAAASEIFDVQVEKGLSLLTIRHYTEETAAEMTAGKYIVLKQQSPHTVQFLLR
ncbi:aspartate kinase [Agriterribacter sp.]|uniref:aspartate kinase n=1 Tax=Agriterribacter sp. TaxID=2821509 RepID=UPI002C9F6B38|nr:aspartate kinase [Agriterribacter sp.]HRP57548.1 aspartate kinase [Agriterribacter sp.]